MGHRVIENLVHGINHICAANSYQTQASNVVLFLLLRRGVFVDGKVFQSFSCEICTISNVCVHFCDDKWGERWMGRVCEKESEREKQN